MLTKYIIFDFVSEVEKDDDLRLDWDVEDFMYDSIGAETRDFDIKMQYGNDFEIILYEDYLRKDVKEADFIKIFKAKDLILEKDTVKSDSDTTTYVVRRTGSPPAGSKDRVKKSLLSTKEGLGKLIDSINDIIESL